MDIKIMCQKVKAREEALKDLETYIDAKHGLAETGNRIVLDNILEKTINAIRGGATTESIEKIFVKYISKYQQNKSYVYNLTLLRSLKT